jgi:hypothetical protein
MSQRAREFDWSDELVAEDLVLRSFHTWIVRRVCIEDDDIAAAPITDTGAFTLHGRVGGHHITLDLVLLEGLRHASGAWELCAAEPHFLGAPARACA